MQDEPCGSPFAGRAFFGKKNMKASDLKVGTLGGQECALLPEMAMENGKATINGHQVASEVSVSVRGSCDLDIQPF